jgi:hypothetical protein
LKIDPLMQLPQILNGAKFTPFLRAIVTLSSTSSNF